MAITYTAAVNIITVTGYTSGTPCTFLDIYNADVAGAWGVVTRQCTNQYCIQARLQIGDGSTATWFADENQQIIIPTGVITGGGWVSWCSKKANANFRLGKCTNTTKKLTEAGCHIWITRDAAGSLTILDGENSSGNVEIYGSQIYFSQGAQQCRFYRCQNGKFWGNNFDHKIQIASATGLDVYNNDYFNVYSGLFAVGGTFDLLRFYRTIYITNLDGTTASNITIKNVIAVENTYVARGFNTAKNLYMINFDVETWAFTYSSYTGKFYRQYEFDLKVIDKDNAAINAATVKIWDKDSNLIVDTTTNASGVIATQTITRGYYNQANGNTLQEASPHLIKIEKAGYTTYEADFTLEDKTDWLIALQTGVSAARQIHVPPIVNGVMIE